MTTTFTHRCVHHPVREAVARCPSCGRFFCRECISEHEDRVLCATCLARSTLKEARARSRVTAVIRPLLVVAGLLIAWSFFDLLGRTLMMLPADVHEGTVWDQATTTEE